MAWRRFGTAVLVSVVALGAGAAGQEKNELAGSIGRTFISDQGVRGVSTFDTLLRSGNGTTFEVDYGRRLLGADVGMLTLEIPAVFNLDEDVHFSVNLVPGDYSAIFVTPSIRANLFPNTAVSPWVGFGGGFGHFGEADKLEFGGTNPGKTGTNTGVIQAGFGVDVRLSRSFRLRGEVRDFNSGVPQLNVDTGKSRQHNIFAGAGVVWHF
jgi:hypothetical protein